MSEHRQVQLGEVATVTMGQSPRGEDCNRSGVGVPLLNGPTEFGPRNPTPAQWTSNPRRMAEVGDVLFCVRGSTTGRMNLADQPYAIGRGIASIRANGPVSDTALLHYLVRLNLPHLLALTTGSTFPNLSKSDIEGLVLEWPASGERTSISAFLNALDDKIDLNQRIADGARELFKAEFRSWIAGQSSVAGQPLGEIAELQKGVSYRRAEIDDSSDVAMVTLKSVGRDGTYRADGLKPYTGKYKAAQMLGEGDLVVAQTDVTQAADLIGRVIEVGPTEDYSTLVASLDLIAVRPSQPGITREFLLGSLLRPAFRHHCLARANGTTVLHLAKDALPTFPVPVPPMSEIARFSDVAQPLLRAARQVQSESVHLAELRDALLPKLLTGELRVGEAEEALEEAAL